MARLPRRLGPISAVAIIAAALAGCGTPRAVDDLSATTGENAVRLALDLDRVDVANRRATEARRRAIERLAQVVAYRRTLFDDHLARHRKAGFKDLIDDYEAWSEDARKEIAPPAGAQPDAPPSAAPGSPGPPGPDAPPAVSRDATVGGLRDVGRRLIQMSTDEGVASGVRFLVGFFKRVKADIDAAKQEAGEAADAVESEARDKETPSDAGS